MQYNKKFLRKLFNCFKVLIGIYQKKKGREVWKEKDLFEIYSCLYRDKELKQFEKIYEIGFIGAECGHKFLKYLYPYLNLFWGRFPRGECLLLREDKINPIVKQVANDFLGAPSRYETLQKWFIDTESKHLLDLEILQKVLEVAGWPGECSSFAICTGISQEKWEALCKEGRDSIILPNFLGRSSNDSYIDFAKTAIFLLNQYEYKDICILQNGDVFFDCGACFGDTAIWAAKKVGNEGMVVAFEPIKEQECVLRKNVEEYLSSKKIFVENFAVSDKTGWVSFEESGAGSTLSEGGKRKIRSVSIDDYCETHEISPDYIKMDIEGSELAALKGAIHTIRNNKPRLAICVYHKPAEDLWEIPNFLKYCVPSYQFYLKKSHYTWETVLFAVAT